MLPCKSAQHVSQSALVPQIAEAGCSSETIAVGKFHLKERSDFQLWSYVGLVDIGESADNRAVGQHRYVAERQLAKNACDAGSFKASRTQADLEVACPTSYS